MFRRLLLVGFMVTFQPGSVIQLFLGIVFCACFLMVQLQANR